MNAHDHDTETDWRPPKTWVPAAPPGAKQPLQPIPERVDLVPVDVGEIWRPTTPIAERTDATDRAIGLLIRFAPMSVVWVVLSGALALLCAYLIPAWWAFVIGLVVFGSCTAITYLAADRQERDYSGAGLERHRINQAAALKRLEMKQMYALKRLVLERYLDHLDRKDGAP